MRFRPHEPRTGILARTPSGGKAMKGVKFVVDESGEKSAVLIDLKEHAELWEDVYDTYLARERAEEPRESLAEVKAKLAAQGKLPKSA
jgi:hypothetical protein